MTCVTMVPPPLVKVKTGRTHFGNALYATVTSLVPDATLVSVIALLANVIVPGTAEMSVPPVSVGSTAAASMARVSSLVPVSTSVPLSEPALAVIRLQWGRRLARRRTVRYVEHDCRRQQHQRSSQNNAS